MNGRRSAISAAVVGMLSALPTVALAQNATGYEGGSTARDRGAVRFDVHLDLGWAAAYGVGFRGDIALAPDGLFDTLDDDLALSLGAEAFVGPSAFGIWPLGAMQWNFYFARRWSVFPELGIVVFTGGKEQHAPAKPFAVVAPFLSAGARYHFSARHALLFRVNWPAGLQVGLTF